MSELRVNSLKGVGASQAAITIDNNSGACAANLSSVNGGSLGTKNLIINGAMNLAQHGVTSTAIGYKTVDRFAVTYGTLDEAPTQAQVDVASGTTPYTLGFRKAFRITNGNQTSGAGAASYIIFRTRIEAQDIANSGWNYTSSSSYLTLSFWIKSSIAQTFKGFLRAADGTEQRYAFETGSLTANTWTKVTKTISGNSNLQFDNDNGVGLEISIGFWGTNYTDGSVTENSWAVYATGTRMLDNTSTWYTTNDATLEMTGFQLEVGSTASSFVHEPEEETLRRCQRYCYAHVPLGSNIHAIMNASQYNSTTSYGYLPFPTTMRAVPTLNQNTGTGYYLAYGNAASTSVSTLLLQYAGTNGCEMKFASARGQGNAVWLRAAGVNTKVIFEAEL